MLGLALGSLGAGVLDTLYSAAQVKKQIALQKQANINSILAARHSQSKASSFSAREAQKNRDYQERMSGTQYQRALC